MIAIATPFRVCMRPPRLDGSKARATLHAAEYRFCESKFGRIVDRQIADRLARNSGMRIAGSPGNPDVRRTMVNSKAARGLALFLCVLTSLVALAGAGC